jgi:hypothetical protein
MARSERWWWRWVVGGEGGRRLAVEVRGGGRWRWMVVVKGGGGWWRWDIMIHEDFGNEISHL